MAGKEGPILAMRSEYSRCFSSSPDRELSLALRASFPDEMQDLVRTRPADAYRLRCVLAPVGRCGEGCYLKALHRKEAGEELVEFYFDRGDAWCWFTTRRRHLGTPELANALLLLL